METLIGFGAMAAGLWAVFRKWQLGAQVKTAETWPTTQGEVISSSIGTEHSGTAGNSNTTFKAKIKYQYEAGGRTRQHHKLCIGGQLQVSWRSKAEEYCRRYSVGQQVTVHYNPKNPADAVLEVREETSWLYLAGGVVFIVVGYLLMTGSFS